MLCSSVNRSRSHANPLRIRTYEIARRQPLCYQHLRRPPVSVHSTTFADTTPFSQIPYDQHIRRRSASVANVELVTPLESALTQTYRLSLLQSALTKSDGGPPVDKGTKTLTQSLLRSEHSGHGEWVTGRRVEVKERPTLKNQTVGHPVLAIQFWRFKSRRLGGRR